jgi:hypothetical protein
VPGRQHLSAAVLTEQNPTPAAEPVPAPPQDPLRRVALVATAILVPVILALAVLVNVRGDAPDADGRDTGPATVQSTPLSPRGDLPVLPVAVPPVTPEAEASCPAVMAALPLELTGEPSRRVQSESLFAYAWGEPPVVLVCGVDRPPGYVAGVSAIQINGVQWYVDTHDPDTTVWTTVDRPVYVQVRLPAAVDSAPVTALSTPIGAALPYREPTPGP